MRFLVADDHELVRKGLIDALGQFAAGAEIHDFPDARTTLDAVRGGNEYDLLLLDLFMPGGDGFELLREVCNSLPDTPVVVLSGSDKPAHIRKSLDLGAAGFIPKSSGMDVMMSALKLVLAGGIYVPPDLLRNPTEDELKSDISVDQLSLPDGLTGRQKEVLRLMGDGKSNKEIARELGLSENTIKIHVAAVLKTLGVNNRTKAAVIARHLALPSED
ncbi:MAG: response regulator transcription factor [Sedimenticola sp.]